MTKYFLMLVMSFSITPCFAELLKIGVAAEPYPPLSTKGADGRWEGFEIDLLNLICQEVNVECEIREVPWDSIVPSLLTQKIDIIFSSMAITEARKRIIIFSAPYYVAPIVIVGTTDSDKKSYHVLTGKIVGVQAGTVSEIFLKSTLAGKTDIRSYDTQDSANRDLLLGRIDYTIGDALALQSLIDTNVNNQKQLYKIILPHDPIFGEGMGAGFRKSDFSMRDRFDVAIRKILITKKYASLSESYFHMNVSPLK